MFVTWRQGGFPSTCTNPRDCCLQSRTHNPECTLKMFRELRTVDENIITGGKVYLLLSIVTLFHSPSSVLSLPQLNITMDKLHKRDLASKITTLEYSEANIILVTEVKCDLIYLQEYWSTASVLLCALINTTQLDPRILLTLSYYTSA